MEGLGARTGHVQKTVLQDREEAFKKRHVKWNIVEHAQNRLKNE
jgi:hypothetical protein